MTEKYQVIYADPPWHYGEKSWILVEGGGFGKEGDAIQNKDIKNYPTMNIEDLKNLSIDPYQVVYADPPWKFPESSSYEWAIEFDSLAKQIMNKGDFKKLINYEKLGKAAQLSIPTPDHYFPLIYALGLKSEGDNISYPIEGISYGSTSMRSVLIN